MRDFVGALKGVTGAVRRWLLRSVAAVEEPNLIVAARGAASLISRVSRPLCGAARLAV